MFLVLLISPLLLTGQDDRTQGFARKATEELTIDGILNESIWRRTEESNHLIVAQPDRFTPEKSARPSKSSSIPNTSMSAWSVWTRNRKR